MVLKYRPYVMKLFGRRSTPRDDKMCVDGKDPDLEGNNMRGYPSIDTPIYVSIFTLLVHSWSRFTR